jgi:hypothetical protein
MISRGRLHLPVVLLAVCCLASACSGRQPFAADPRPVIPSEFVRVQPAVTRRVARMAGPANQLVVVEGSSCAETPRGAIEIPGSESLPSFATAATVFLNGWKLRYLSSDHKVQFILAKIAEVKLEGQTLSWVARGLLADRNGDDGYEFCYWYVVVGWSPTLIDAATANANTASISATRTASGDVEAGELAPAYASAYARIPAAVGKRTIAVLPRGFHLTKGGAKCQYTPVRLCYGFASDSHVLQLGYVMGQTERFLPAGTFNFFQDDAPFPGPGRFEDGLVSWRSSGILKDNDAGYVLTVSEETTTLYGNGVDVLQPPYAPSVRDNTSSPSTVVGGWGIQTVDVTVESLPFQFVIPMLAGWELRYPYDDENVSEVGIWVHELSQTGVPATLQYKLSWVLRDKDNIPASLASHKVNLLGLRTGPP